MYYRLDFILYVTILVSLIPNTKHSQLSITSSATDYTIDFDQTVAGVNNGTFQGSGFTPNPNSGQLDSDGWRAWGSQNQGMFGGSHTTSAFARGVHNGGVNNGNQNAGIYSFDRGNSTSVNRTLGIQPFSNVFNPGYLALKIHNNTGSTIQDLSVTFDIYFFNDQSGNTTFYFSHSSHGDPGTTGMPWITESSLNDTTPGPADPPPVTWSSSSPHSIVLENLNIPDGSFYYIRWTIDDASGSTTTTDEISLDNIVVNAVEVLPVEWVSFKTKKIEGHAQLIWQTMNEINHDHFIVQHSTDGRNWTSIGRVEEATNSGRVETYSFLHKDPAPGTNLYRILQMDVDGSESMSTIRKLRFIDHTSPSVSLFPNPVRSLGQISIHAGFQIEQIQLIGQSGSVLKEWSGDNKTLSLPDIPSGTYYVRISGGSTVEVKRIIIE